MISSNFLVLCLATAASAVPALMGRSGEADDFTVLPSLKTGEVLVNNENGWEVISNEAYAAMLKAENITIGRPPIDHDLMRIDEDEDDVNVTDTSLAKRQCSVTAMLITRTDRFSDWDLQMSPILAARNKDMTISVTQTYTVTDTLTIQGSVSPTIIKNWLTGQVGASVSRSWATATAITVGGTVASGNTGAMVVNPWKTRRYGEVRQGCVGSQKVVATFMSDTFESGAYRGVSWIRGPISLCERPGNLNRVARCQGSGYLE